jgi:small subunit ribosomal protein S10
MKLNYTLYIQLKSNHKTIINHISKQIKNQAESFNLIPKGPIILPATSKLYTVLRSPHVHKKARDQFELKTVRRLLVLKFNSKDMINLKFLLNNIYNLSSSVQVKINFKKNYYA